MTFTLPTALALISASISILALVIALKNYRRKEGVYVRGIFSIASSRACNDAYVSEVVLENLKDRAVTIFAIYLRIGHNYYVELENLEENPLVLKAFETYRRHFGPLEFYAASCNRIILKNLLQNSAVRKQIILSTSNGKYTVPSRIRRWSPIGDIFENHLTTVVRPIYLKHKDKYLGGNIAYVVELVGSDGAEIIIPIHPKDYEVRVFSNFSLTTDSLSSKEALEQLLQKQIDGGNLTVDRYAVHDVNAARTKAHEFYSGATVVSRSYSALQYYIMGPILTKLADWRLNRENASRTRVQRAADK
jgi:hypothetical protein